MQSQVNSESVWAEPMAESEAATVNPTILTDFILISPAY